MVVLPLEGHEPRLPLEGSVKVRNTFLQFNDGTGDSETNSARRTKSWPATCRRTESTPKWSDVANEPESFSNSPVMAEGPAVAHPSSPYGVQEPTIQENSSLEYPIGHAMTDSGVYRPSIPWQRKGSLGQYAPQPIGDPELDPPQQTPCGSFSRQSTCTGFSRQSTETPMSRQSTGTMMSRQSTDEGLGSRCGSRRGSKQSEKGWQPFATWSQGLDDLSVEDLFESHSPPSGTLPRGESRFYSEASSAPEDDVRAPHSNSSFTQNCQQLPEMGAHLGARPLFEPMGPGLVSMVMFPPMAGNAPSPSHANARAPSIQQLPMPAQPVPKQPTPGQQQPVPPQPQQHQVPARPPRQKQHHMPEMHHEPMMQECSPMAAPQPPTLLKRHPMQHPLQTTPMKSQQPRPVQPDVAEQQVTVGQLPNAVTCTYSATGNTSVRWEADARKLNGSDKMVVSPEFLVRLPGLGAQPFRLLIYAAAASNDRGSLSFRTTGGRGRVEIKCGAQLPNGLADVLVAIGVGAGDRAQPMRGPVSHNFLHQSCCGLRRGEEEWDFRAAVNNTTKRLTIRAELSPLVSPSR